MLLTRKKNSGKIENCTDMPLHIKIPQKNYTKRPVGMQYHVDKKETKAPGVSFPGSL
jgi:hypothetical protein